METPERVHHSLNGRTVLLAEDNEDEVFLMQRAFRKANIANPLQTVGDGQEALDYLEGRQQFSDRIQYPYPAVVFLDLNMPKKGGLEVLAYVRAHSSLQNLTILIISSSTRPADIDQAAHLGANGYLIKPTRIEKFQELIQDWHSLSKFQAYPST